MADKNHGLRDSEIDRIFQSDSEVISDSENESSGISTFSNDEDIVQTNLERDSEESDTPECGAGDGQITRPRPRAAIRVPPVWSRQINYVEPNIFSEESGVIHELSACPSEIDYFNLLVGGDAFFENIAHCTNAYAEYKQQSGTIDSNWTPVTVQEIKALIGVDIFMGIYDFPSTEEYFREDLVSCPPVRQTMTYSRYKKINQYFHVTDIFEPPNRQDENYDTLYKVRRVLKINDTFKNYYKPQRDLAVDEAMIGFKGRFCLKQYMPKKPVKWGMKMWAIACSKTGYFLGGKLYLGKKEPKNSDLLLGEQVVLNLAEPFFGKNHHVYYDNFFSSFNLCNILLQKDTYSCGTVRSNRFGWPTELKTPKKLKLVRGESVSLQSGRVVATVWRDNRDVMFFSTNSDPQIEHDIERRTGKGAQKIVIKCPEVVVQYTKNMGGVDRSDQYRSYYSFGRPSKKWWKYIYHFVINTAIVNAYILNKLSNRPEKTKHGSTQLEFRKALLQQLIGNFSSRKQIGRKRSLPCAITSPKTAHKLEKLEHGRVCGVCATKKRKTDSGRGIRTYWKCNKCNIPFCKTNCFLEYHQEKGVEISQ